jgi:hypothetical protein
VPDTPAPIAAFRQRRRERRPPPPPPPAAPARFAYPVE